MSTIKKGETDLQQLIANMEPILNQGEYVFASVPDITVIPRERTVCEMREKEGMTIVFAVGIGIVDIYLHCNSKKRLIETTKKLEMIFSMPICYVYFTLHCLLLFLRLNTPSVIRAQDHKTKSHQALFLLLRIDKI